ncbi:hypothetical protein R4609_00695 [Acinetobacter baumannii]|uniref:hypothetical protein n=1 Tax=Acinetobacter calcoaceticus/baumannii complex TaxID=909768 RepID=UPI0029560243|nr:hypothetical protein [Acinetobacter pittii]MDV7596180.1 hypothetical protein [Acinetobacter baumannii]MEB6670660.1 hypothetical protein [Acinetobacter pittii]HAV5499804.1 hypothetical protein [Acinetobacter baumannii]
MRFFLWLIAFAAVIIFYFSIKFGFDLKTAKSTLFYLIIWSAFTYVIYRFYDDAGYPKIWFYLIFGILLSFCFYPLLEFYSLKPISYDWLDWLGFRERTVSNEENQQRWYGRNYGKFGVTVIFSLIAIIIQQLFDNDD